MQVTIGHLPNSLPYAAKTPNIMNDVAQFLACWASGAPADERRLLKSPWGNINFTGETHVSAAPDLVPRDSRWNAGIEPGVAPLVEFLITHTRLVTYDSCEGHRYPPHLLIEPAVRRVGILPRSTDELHAALQLGRMLSTAMAELLKHSAVSFVAYRTGLHSVADATRVWDAVELEYRRSHGTSWDDYFCDLESASSLTLAVLKVLAGDVRAAE